MRITGISTAVIEANYDWTLVRVDSDQGVSGIGECFTSPGLTTLIREIAQLLIGEDPSNVEPLLRLMRNATAHAASGGGAVHHAITGIESALWELNARALGLPLYQLFGGAFRTNIRIYADCHAGDALHSYSAVLQERIPAWAAGTPAGAGTEGLGVHWDTRDEAGVYTPEAYARRAREMAGRGFSALKFDVDLPRLAGEDLHARTISQRQLERQVALAQAAVEAVGPDVGVAFDCHWRYSASDALRLARALEHIPLLWLEDPVPPENVSALAGVTTRTSTPILTGENTYLASGFEQLIAAGAVDIVAPDIQKAGGLAEARRICEVADRHYIPVAPHNISGPIGTLLSAHLCAATPNFLALEWHAASVPFFDELLTTGRPLIEAGSIQLDPQAPGIGRDLDLDACARYARRDEPFFA
jgi:gluconate/galactonate dehydratase